MAQVINCECGKVVRSDSEDDLVAQVEQHMREAHPEMVGNTSRTDILAMAHEE